MAAPPPPLSRVVALIDMDCFYCAAERALDPSLMGIPIAVVQYNPYENGRNEKEDSVGGVSSLPAEPASARVAFRNGKVVLPAAQNGSIIAVSYEARKRGVTRFFRGKEAVAQCPEMVLIQVPTAHGKSDMGVYRMFGAKALKRIRETCGDGVLVEKASVDEMYLDVTIPAKALLAAADSHADVFAEALNVGTHVAGRAEADDEAGRGAQPGGVLARNSFRAGHSGQVERSIDDASAAWWTRDPHDWPQDEVLLAAGACVVARARAAVTADLGFTCSAGIAANKLLAKLCGGLHKPNQQTVLPPSSVRALLDPLPVDRLRGFGGKLGELLRSGRPDLDPPLEGYATAGELRKAGTTAVAKLLRGEWNHAEEQAAAACRLAGGEDTAPVEERALPKQVGSSKNFGGNRGSARGPLDTKEIIERWVRELAGDLAARLIDEVEENLREPTALIVSIRFEDDGFAWQPSKSKRCTLPRGGGSSSSSSNGALSVEGLTRAAMGLIGHLSSGRSPTRLACSMLGLTLDNFVPTASANAAALGSSNLKRMFEAAQGASSSSVAVEQEAAGKRSRVDEEAEAEAAVAAVAAYEAEAIQAAAAPSRASSTAASPVKGEPWACSACTLLNEAAARRCILCDAMRGGTLAGASTLAQQQQQPTQPSQQPERREQKRGGGGNAQSGRGRGRGSKQLQTQNTERSIAGFFSKKP